MTTPPSIDTSDVRHCIKCGRQIGGDETICGACNRAGMATPSASQYHGTVVVAIVLAVAALAFAASFSLRGVGPYHAHVVEVAPAEPVGVSITYAVTNEGTRAGRAKCQLVALGAAGERLRARSTVTSSIDGGGTIQHTEAIPGLVGEPDEVRVSCS